jgi:hypothetical protein
MAYIQSDAGLPSNIDKSGYQQIQEAVAGGAPPNPIPKVEIHKIPLQDYMVLREKTEPRSFKTLINDPSITNLDVLEHLALNIGHSRALTAEEFISFYQASDSVPANITSKQWLELKNTTFPLSALSSEEQDAIQSHIAKIIEYASLLGLNILILYCTFFRKCAIAKQKE